MAKQLRRSGGVLAILLVLAAFIFASLQGAGAVYGQGGGNIYLPLLLSGCTNAIPYQPAVDLNLEIQMLEALNHQRANHGLPPLVMNESLVQIARYHSMDMAVSGVTSHTGSEGDSPWDRYDWLCETFAAKGEIIGWSTSSSVDTMVNLWMNSDGHRKIILDDVYSVAGVGYVYLADSEFGHYWTVDFGSKP